ncbi:acetylhydrolase [Bradyrhizobium sp. NAS80.1]|uniref:alpha/beta hydrolase n=1 Tax=Bradyrhizobium sp. NAS80.1 TaxID=1680159 RepID=UPI000967D786|nr:alpha/beta hydrolase [Bradyrhizobium sp. NAS80.1]OKO76964.1 acetylhydrolase [Bradyrhizobium sp. NAS80.1]
MKIHHIDSGPHDRQYVDGLLRDKQFQSIYSAPTTVEAMRGGTATLAVNANAASSVSPVTISASEESGIPCERMTPNDGDGSKVILFLHGGGFVRGSLALARVNAVELSAVARVPVLAAGYRQAPEHRFPAAVQDALTVYRRLLESGYAPENIVVVGESAGGCLALTLPDNAARENLPAPPTIVGISPMIDLRMRGASWQFNAGRDIATAKMGEQMISLYLDDATRDHPLAAPINATIVRGTAILLCVGTHEVMLSDVERYAHRADHAEANVTLNLYDGMPHGFTKFDIPVAKRALADVARWCRAHLYHR